MLSFYTLYSPGLPSGCYLVAILDRGQAPGLVKSSKPSGRTRADHWAVLQLPLVTGSMQPAMLCPRCVLEGACGCSASCFPCCKFLSCTSCWLVCMDHEAQHKPLVQSHASLNTPHGYRRIWSTSLLAQAAVTVYRLSQTCETLYELQHVVLKRCCLQAMAALQPCQDRECEALCELQRNL